MVQSNFKEYRFLKKINLPRSVVLVCVSFGTLAAQNHVLLAHYRIIADGIISFYF